MIDDYNKVVMNKIRFRYYKLFYNIKEIAMKKDVDYIVNALKTVLKPLIEDGSIDYVNMDLTTELGFSLKNVIYDDKSKNLVIITPDRPEKSAVIG